MTEHQPMQRGAPFPARLTATCLAVLLGASLTPVTAPASPDLEGIACRSVHLSYDSGPATAYYNEQVIERSAEGSYFMACGFNMGYFGVQELTQGRKVVLFSVWDPGNEQNPQRVASAQQVRVLYQAPDVRVRRFGGEGTGGQCFFDYNWQTGQVCRFLVTATPSSNRTAFTGYFYLPEARTWKQLVSFETISGGIALEGLHSFVEDFRRNRVSATQVRQARYGNLWALERSGRWKALTRARFTGDGNPVLNIDAGVTGHDFFLATGGGTTNTHTRLWQHAERVPAAPQPPVDLPLKR